MLAALRQIKGFHVLLHHFQALHTLLAPNNDRVNGVMAMLDRANRVVKQTFFPGFFLAKTHPS